MLKIADKIATLITHVVSDMGYELIGVKYVFFSKNSILRIYIDKEKGITLNDCEKVSRQLSAMFDVENPISGKYNLEVSSPGISRPLFSISHYHRFLGHDVKLKLIRPLNDQRRFSGTIGKVSEAADTIELLTSLGAITLDINMIEKANLVATF